MFGDERDDAESDCDDLEDLIAEITRQNPNFPRLLEEARRERMAMIARGEDPNDSPQDGEKEDEGQETSKVAPAAPRPS